MRARCAPQSPADIVDFEVLAETMDAAPGAEDAPEEEARRMMARARSAAQGRARSMPASVLVACGCGAAGRARAGAQPRAGRGPPALCDLSHGRPNPPEPGGGARVGGRPRCRRAGMCRRSTQRWTTCRPSW